jgi:hypothetical protein
MTAIGAQEKIDAYLSRLRSLLRGMSSDDIREIVEELRSHIVDKSTVNGELTAAGVDAALEALGRPEELASEYLTDAALARAEVSRSPFRILASLFRWASFSVAGFFALIGSLLGYFLGVSLVLCALLKPFHPQNAGLWSYRDSAGDLELSVRLGFGSAPAGGHDVLGMWIVPIGLALGGCLVLMTTQCAIWCARCYRRSRVARRG